MPDVDLLTKRIVASPYALEVLKLVDAWGHSSATILADLDLARQDLVTPGSTITWRTMSDIIVRAQAMVGDEVLGYHIGVRARATVSGFIGFACLTSGTLGESIDITIRYSRLSTDALSVHLERDGDRAQLVIKEQLDVSAAREVVVWGVLAGFWHVAEEITGRSLAGDVEFMLPAPSRHAMRNVILPGGARFGAEQNRLIFPASFLDLPLVRSDATAKTLAVTECERVAAQMKAANGFVSHVRRALVHPLRPGFRDQSELARVLGVSRSTLKRRFNELGTSYSQELVEAQKARAIALLASRDRTVAEAAELMGYSEPASFARAFRKWFGESPGRYRRPNRDVAAHSAARGTASTLRRFRAGQDAARLHDHAS